MMRRKGMRQGLGRRSHFQTYEYNETGKDLPDSLHKVDTWPQGFSLRKGVHHVLHGGQSGRK